MPNSEIPEAHTCESIEVAKKPINVENCNAFGVNDVKDDVISKSRIVEFLIQKKRDPLYLQTRCHNIEPFSVFEKIDISYEGEIRGFGFKELQKNEVMEGQYFIVRDLKVGSEKFVIVWIGCTEKIHVNSCEAYVEVLDPLLFTDRMYGDQPSIWTCDASPIKTETDLSAIPKENDQLVRPVETLSTDTAMPCKPQGETQSSDTAMPCEPPAEALSTDTAMPYEPPAEALSTDTAMPCEPPAEALSTDTAMPCEPPAQALSSKPQITGPTSREVEVFNFSDDDDSHVFKSRLKESSVHAFTKDSSILSCNGYIVNYETNNLAPEIALQEKRLVAALTKLTTTDSNYDKAAIRVGGAVREYQAWHYIRTNLVHEKIYADGNGRL